jgi:hypothetical protein
LKEIKKGEHREGEKKTKSGKRERREERRKL